MSSVCDVNETITHAFEHCFDVWKNNRAQFILTAEEWTKKFAM